MASRNGAAKKDRPKNLAWKLSFFTDDWEPLEAMLSITDSDTAALLAVMDFMRERRRLASEGSPSFSPYQFTHAVTLEVMYG